MRLAFAGEQEFKSKERVAEIRLTLKEKKTAFT
jgi:hypothetical protein